MNAYAAFAVTEHIDYLLDEAAQRRSLRTDKPSLRQRIASAASHASHALSMPMDNRGTILPKLQDYPYRG